ncbi:hypothetical protein I2200191F5_24590 [Blautia wexlerae]
MKSSIYANHKNGFYVRALPNKCEPSKVIKYIGRYLGHPVIATSRIDSYDGDFVTFHYNRHEDEKLITETVPVLDFISMLTQHIPEKHFKMIRYYGLYARHRKSDLKLHRAISNEYITEAQLAKELREKYMKNPPEGMTSAEVRSMSDDELLDMDYFFHEFDDINDDDFGEEGFYIF